MPDKFLIAYEKHSKPYKTYVDENYKEASVMNSLWASSAMSRQTYRMTTSSNRNIFHVTGGNSPVTGEFPAQRPATRSFDVFFDLRLNKRLSKQSWGWLFGTSLGPLWRHCNELPLVHVMVKCLHGVKLYPAPMLVVLLQIIVSKVCIRISISSCTKIHLKISSCKI